MDSPLRLNADNFTPPARTPWGGRVIMEHLKAGLLLDPEKAAYPVVGESWEVSVEPSFPSRAVDLEGRPLLERVIARDPVQMLGPSVARRHGGFPLLVKLLDAAAPLSVQVHPGDEDPCLRPGQSGKPECWLVVRAEPGAGIYLELKDGVDRPLLRSAVESGGDLACLMNWVPVSAGDCFEIEPGTIHAIGAGVTLVEPQRVIPGHEGVTYRLWDWNRRYDGNGHLNAGGRPRALHLEEALCAIRFARPGGESSVDRLRRRPVTIGASTGVAHHRLVDSASFRVETLTGSGRIELSFETMTALVVVEGRMRISCSGGVTELRQGESAAVPFAASPARCELSACLAVMARPA